MELLKILTNIYKNVYCPLQQSDKFLNVIFAPINATMLNDTATKLTDPKQSGHDNG